MSNASRLMLVVLLGLLLAASGFYIGNKLLNEPMALPEEDVVYILESGETLTDVTVWLKQKGFFNYPDIIKVYSRLTDKGRIIKAGEYTLNPGMSVLDFLNKLTTGDVVQYNITFVEGITVRQMLSLLAEVPNIIHTENLTPDTILSKINVSTEYQSSEGLFFPDTYSFSTGARDLDILKTAYSKMDTLLNSQWESRNLNLNLPYTSKYEVLIMASLIEKETGDPSEREEISGVFYRRLQRNMRLQTDPTVIYGLGETFDGNLKRKHLRDSSNPYNTYRHSGLPPGPIALPGAASISAALNPASGEALYFVAKGDGTHVFSNTLAEHEKAVREYQILSRKKNYRSSPSPAK